MNVHITETLTDSSITVAQSRKKFRFFALIYFVTMKKDNSETIVCEESKVERAAT